MQLVQELVFASTTMESTRLTLNLAPSLTRHRLVPFISRLNPPPDKTGLMGLSAPPLRLHQLIMVHVRQVWRRVPRFRVVALLVMTQTC